MSKERRRPGFLAVLVAALTLTISGCVAPDPVETPPPTTTDEPVFASEEEALAAAEKAYADYLAMSDLIAQEGGANPERLRGVATGQALEKGVADASRYSDSGLFGEGRSTFDGLTLQSIAGAPESPQVLTYLCLDVSETQIVNSNGEVQVATPGSPRVGLQVAFDWSAAEARLLTANSELWEGAGVC